jgi:hypothetical protein
MSITNGDEKDKIGREANGLTCQLLRNVKAVLTVVINVFFPVVFSACLAAGAKEFRTKTLLSITRVENKYFVALARL